MFIRTSRRRMATVITLGTVAVVATLVQQAGAQTLVESSAEARFQLDLQVPQAALMSFVPSGWTTNVSTQGNAKDANLRAIFIERLTINGPDGSPAGDGSNLLVYLTVPVTNPEGDNVQLVIGGITEDPADAPGPFGVYLSATTHTLKRTTTSGAGPIIETQDWVFSEATGGAPGNAHHVRAGCRQQSPSQGCPVLLGEEPGFLSDLQATASPGHLAKRDDEPARPGTGVLVYGRRRQLRRAVRRYGASLELG